MIIIIIIIIIVGLKMSAVGRWVIEFLRELCDSECGLVIVS